MNISLTTTEGIKFNAVIRIFYTATRNLKLSYSWYSQYSYDNLKLSFRSPTKNPANYIKYIPTYRIC